MGEHHDHDHGAHDDGHDHAHTAPPSDYALRVKAIETLLSEKHVIDRQSVDAFIDIFEHQIGPRHGARVVAKAWRDAAFKQRLLANGTAAIAELGIGGVQGEDLIVVENTPAVHNVVVCTLCSCYPWPLLGLPPSWYKSFAYRARIVIEPRQVLAEFGLDIDADCELRVWDSNAEVRYLVLPMCPPGTEEADETRLAELVSRDSMIGTGLAGTPPQAR